MSKELIIFCDESLQKGKHFSNFYGGALVSAQYLEEIEGALEQKKAALNFHGEVKWSKITEPYREKYIQLMDVFFDFVKAGKIKIRIMFTQNMYVPTYDDKLGNTYFKLYYQFIKHAFGLQFCNPDKATPVNLRILFDQLPDTKEQSAQFKAFIKGLEKNPQFRDSNIKIPDGLIGEISSHDHCILQCLDIVLGGMQFRLNDKHLEKPEGKRRRGKKTVAKEAVYNHVNKRIRDIYSGFNVGVSTAQKQGQMSRWKDPYRHWNFRPAEFEIDRSYTKK
jgi:hypothetical protein